MPFTPYKSSLDPEALGAAQASFDMAWAEASLPDQLDEQTARNLIARRIMDALESGERDPVRLTAYALTLRRYNAASSPHALRLLDNTRV